MMSAFQHFIMATAGHVDHGKSALIKALTGTDPDRLPEEKLRGITIELGFAHLELPSSQPGSPFLLGIVDVPGHEDFVKNMVAGVGSIDLALLVVAADDRWMPQTEEHLQILTYLGVSHAVVALTKSDLARDESAAVAEIREKLRGTPFAEAPIVATSVIDGRGLDCLKSTVAAVLTNTPPPADIGKPRLPVDRVFKLQGIGTVVTGTLTGGTLRHGQTVVIQPSGKKARIRNIQRHNCDLEFSGPGTRTALNLADVDTAEGIQRGDTITLDALGSASKTIDVLMDVSPRANLTIKADSRVRVHHGSSNVPARVVLYDGKRLQAGERSLTQLRLEAPAFLFAGDRFIVRDWSEQNTLAGGVVLDPDAKRESFRRKDRSQFLSARAHSPSDISVCVYSQIVLAGAARRSELLAKSRFREGDISDAVASLVAAGKAVLAEDCVFDSEKWQAMCLRAASKIDSHHRAHPEQTGLPVLDLRANLREELLDEDFVDAFLGGFCGRDFERAGAVIRRATHRPALSPQLQAAGQKLRSILAAKPFDPPSRNDLAPDPISQQALRFLIDTGEAVEITKEVVMTPESVKQAIELIRRFIRERGPATVSELRVSLSSSRRVMVPLLERLDRDGITLRKDDRRILRK